MNHWDRVIETLRSAAMSPLHSFLWEADKLPPTQLVVINDSGLHIHFSISL